MNPFRFSYANYFLVVSTPRVPGLFALSCASSLSMVKPCSALFTNLVPSFSNNLTSFSSSPEVVRRFTLGPLVNNLELFWTTLRSTVLESATIVRTLLSSCSMWLMLAPTLKARTGLTSGNKARNVEKFKTRLTVSTSSRRTSRLRLTMLLPTPNLPCPSGSSCTKLPIVSSNSTGVCRHMSSRSGDWVLQLVSSSVSHSIKRKLLCKECRLSSTRSSCFAQSSHLSSNS